MYLVTKNWGIFEPTFLACHLVFGLHKLLLSLFIIVQCKKNITSSKSNKLTADKTLMGDSLQLISRMIRGSSLVSSKAQ